ncbi:unnamed protein product [Caenorhabditis bovis]|uniref:Uncharacterized protein n=1 Tax=Caenorhabditis bovis TaxID=2654633 RepID=A0A8S1FAS8_9PELO|nr:unnamed protein product [Caenorhabditis bovis]
MSVNAQFVKIYHPQPLHLERYHMSTSSSSFGGNSVRKQILPLKPKMTNNVQVQRLEYKSKKVDVPVTNLELKKDKQRNEKNIVTTLAYRKPAIRNIETSIGDCGHRMRRPGSPSSSGYETDPTENDNQENFDNYSAYSGSFCNFIKNHVHNHGLDMLHSHPVWGPVSDVYSFNNNNNNNSNPTYEHYGNENHRSFLL